MFDTSKVNYIYDLNTDNVLQWTGQVLWLNIFKPFWDCVYKIKQCLSGKTGTSSNQKKPDNLDQKTTMRKTYSYVFLSLLFSNITKVLFKFDQSMPYNKQTIIAKWTVKALFFPSTRQNLSVIKLRYYMLIFWNHFSEVWVET